MKTKRHNLYNKMSTNLKRAEIVETLANALVGVQPMDTPNETLFHLDFVTGEQVQERQFERQFITKENESEYIFEGEILYRVGRGHDFIRGFFIGYITESNKVYRNFNGTNFWQCEHKDAIKEFTYENNKLTPVEKKPHVTLNFDSIELPLIKNVHKSL